MISSSTSPLPTFDAAVLPHLAAARRLARWLIHNPADADDAVQEATLRALRYFATFTGGNSRAWFLRIVRNTCLGWRLTVVRRSAEPFDELTHAADPVDVPDPEVLLLRADDRCRLARAMRQVPVRLRRLLRLREWDGLSYREIAEVTGLPMGTVMSGLSRARARLRRAW